MPLPPWPTFRGLLLPGRRKFPDAFAFRLSRRLALVRVDFFLDDIHAPFVDHFYCTS